MDNIKTLTGLSLPELAAKLDEQLPPDAYTPVPGGADLTDIDPGYMRKVLTEVFGPCGFGWGYEYDPKNISTHYEKRSGKTGEREVAVAVITQLVFWYKLFVDGSEIICEVPSTGASENSAIGYALSGAVTNALGKAVSNIGFQESVYLGKRTHKTVRKPSAPAASEKPSAPAASDIEDLDAPAEPDGGFNLEGFVIPIGKRAGQKLGEQSIDVLTWYAYVMLANMGEQRALKAAAQALVKVRSNGHHQPVAAK